jgi:hypothetical protein
MSSAVGGPGRLSSSDVLAVSEVLSAVTQLISIGLTRRETGRSTIGPRERGIQFRGLGRQVFSMDGVNDSTSGAEFPGEFKPTKRDQRV